MQVELQRRTLLISAISIAVGFRATRPVGAQSMTLDTARDVIGDRYQTFQLGDADRTLAGEQIADLVAGNTLYGVASHGEPYVAAFRPDGSARLAVTDEPVQSGRWWIDGDEIVGHWERTGGGSPHAHSYFGTGEEGVYKQRRRQGYADGLNKWSMFLVDPGIADELMR